MAFHCVLLRGCYSLIADLICCYCFFTYLAEALFSVSVMKGFYDYDESDIIIMTKLGCDG